MVWGGNRLRTEFGYDIPGEDTGECWAIAAHKNGDCRIDGGKYDGRTLSWLWKNEPALFGRNDGSKEEIFPLLVKIIDAKKDLSIQVHPDDEYAYEHENGAKGKTECWYILDCDPGATIIIGHNAKSHEELEHMISTGNWGGLLREIPIKKGDFFQIFPGTVHAIKGGTMILETQQNSDVTYRVYDYGRLQNGKPRELHIDKSLDVIRAPFDPDAGYERGEALEGSSNEALVRCDPYRVWHIRCNGSGIYRNCMNSFMLCSVTEGEGTVSTDGCSAESVRKGDHFILPYGFESFSLFGDIEMICSAPGGL